MPRLTGRGEVIQGLGLVPLTDDLIIGQRPQPDGSWAVSTGPTVAGPWTVVEHHGCNFIAAGGGNWAAFGGTIFGPAAVPGAAIPAGLDGRGNGAPDGTILLVKNSETGGLILKRLTGPSLEIPDAWPTSNACVIDRDRALWVDARGGIRTCGGLPVPLTLPGPVLWPAVFWALEQWWIAYHSTDGIGYVCHPFTSLDGYPIAKIPAFYPHAVAIDGSTARAAWSLDSAESPAAMRATFLDLTLPRVPLGGTVPPIPPIDPEPPMSFQAPNELATVQKVMHEHPEIDTTDEAERGQILDYTCADLGGKPWGRKSRNKQGTDLNTDALCYLRTDGKFEIYDVISGVDGSATWEAQGIFAQGENGWWVPALPVSTTPPPNPNPPGTLPPGVYPIVYPPGYVPPKDLNDWIEHEFPKLVDAHVKTQGFAPDYTWAAFQTCRRYGAGLPQGEPAWTFEKMLKHELGLEP